MNTPSYAQSRDKGPLRHLARCTITRFSGASGTLGLNPDLEKGHHVCGSGDAPVTRIPQKPIIIGLSRHAIVRESVVQRDV